MKEFLLHLRRKGDFVNTLVAKATAKVLNARSNDRHLKSTDLFQQHELRVCLGRLDFVKVQPLSQNQNSQNWPNEKQDYCCNTK